MEAVLSRAVLYWFWYFLNIAQAVGANLRSLGFRLLSLSQAALDHWAAAPLVLIVVSLERKTTITLKALIFREIALMSKGATAEPSNPFGEIEEEDEEDAEADDDEGESLDVAIPEWLAELPDDLEVSELFCLSVLRLPLP